MRVRVVVVNLEPEWTSLARLCRFDGCRQRQWWFLFTPDQINFACPSERVSLGDIARSKDDGGLPREANAFRDRIVRAATKNEFSSILLVVNSN